MRAPYEAPIAVRAGSLALLIGVIVATGAQRMNADAAAFFTEELQAASVEVPDATQSAIRLAYAAELARRVPFFGIGSTDTTALEAAASELDDVSAYAAEFQESRAARRAVRDALYPTRLLRALVRAEESRRAFVSAPSPQLARTYRKRLGELLYAYRSDVRAFAHAYDSIVEDGFEYRVIGGVVRKENTLEAAAHLERSIENLRTELFGRDACVRGDTARCDKNALLFPTPDTASTRDVRTLPERVRRNWNALAEASGLENTPPVVALRASACLPGNTGLQYFAVHERAAEADYPTGVRYLNEWYFYALDGSPAADGSVLEFLRDHGVSWVPYLPTSFYKCPGLGRDHAAVLGAWKADALLRAQNAAYAAQNRDVVMGEDVENALRQFLLTAAFQELSRAEQNVFVNGLLAMRNDSAGFEYLVEQVAFVGYREKHARDAGVPIEWSARRLFSLQSGFPSLFLPGEFGYSGTDAVEARESAQGGRLRTWSELRDTLGEKALVPLLRTLFDFHAASGAFETSE